MVAPIERDQDDLWLLDLATGNQSRFTFDSAYDENPIWSPDGTRVVFDSNRLGPRSLFVKASNGAGGEDKLLALSNSIVPMDWSRDGRFLLYASIDPKSGSDLWILPMTGDRKPIPFLQGPSSEGQGKFSPDGRWIAYASDESGKAEIYVQSFPGLGGGKWQISMDGGTQPRWRHDGKELFFLSHGRIMSAEIKQSSSFEAGAPAVLFEIPLEMYSSPGSGVNNSSVDYASSTDGMRFLVNAWVEDPGLAPIAIVENWHQ